MANIYNVIDTVHEMMEQIVCHCTTLQLNTADVVNHFRSCKFYLTRDAVIFNEDDAFTMGVFADHVKFGTKSRVSTFPRFSGYVVALREDGNWVDDLVQKYFA